jgi:hypothetical protein
MKIGTIASPRRHDAGALLLDPIGKSATGRDLALRRIRGRLRDIGSFSGLARLFVEL